MLCYVMLYQPNVSSKKLLSRRADGRLFRTMAPQNAKLRCTIYVRIIDRNVQLIQTAIWTTCKAHVLDIVNKAHMAC